ncbi:MAG TPA: hypothetical protein VF997_13900, partial [Polyangia bacterium]
TFDAASRIVPPAEATTEPKLPRIDVAAAPVTQPQPALSSATVPDLRDEMEELAREFAEAAARFTPVRVKRPAAVTAPAAPAPSDAPEALLPARPPLVEEPTRPGVLHASLLGSEAAPAVAAPPAAAPPVAAPPVAAPSEAVRASQVAVAAQLSLEAEPAGEDELAAAAPTQSHAPTAPTQSHAPAPPTQSLAPAPPPQSLAPAPPRSWLELADPGLASLQPPPSPGAAALEALLDESSTIALPSPPAAS